MGFFKDLLSSKRFIGAASISGLAYFFTNSYPTLLSTAAVMTAGFIGWELGGSIGEKKLKNQYVYYNYKKNGSYPNFLFSNSKIKWTSFEIINSFLNKEKNEKNFYVNEFRFDNKVKQYFNLINKHLAKKAEQQELKLNWEDLKKGNLILGKMGSGKTKFIQNIINQWLKTNRKMVIHDTKGEFVSYYYNEDTDYILNYLDIRGAYWDFFEDIDRGLSIEKVKNFFNLYFHAVNGESNDKFWENNAAQRFEKFFYEMLFDVANSNEEDKFYSFLKRLKRYFLEAKNNDNNRTEKSISTTLESAVDIFFKQYTQKKLNRKKFLITEFFESKSSKVFLHTISEVSEANTPFLSALLTVIIKHQLSFEEKAKEENYVLYVLDEYLKFFNLLDKNMKKELHTLARSYGILLLPAIQFLPKNEEARQILTASYQNLFVFKVSDLDTLKYLEKLTQIQVETRNKFNRKETDFKTEKISLLSSDFIQSLKQFRHISYIEKNGVKLLYEAYTKDTKNEEINKTYIADQDFHKYYYQFSKDIEEQVLAENF